MFFLLPLATIPPPWLVLPNLGKGISPSHNGSAAGISVCSQTKVIGTTAAADVSFNKIKRKAFDAEMEVKKDQIRNMRTKRDENRMLSRILLKNRVCHILCGQQEVLPSIKLCVCVSAFVCLYMHLCVYVSVCLSVSAFVCEYMHVCISAGGGVMYVCMSTYPQYMNTDFS